MEQEQKENTRTQTCTRCRETFDSVGYLLVDRIIYPHQCFPCGEQLRAEKLAAEKRDAEARNCHQWNEYCPFEFRTVAEGGPTDLEQLRREQPRIEDAMKWQYGRRGLLFMGDTGAGKTRVAFRILRREFESGRKFMVIKAHRFGLEAANSQVNGGFLSWFNQLVRTPLLFIDDFGKGRFSEAVESHWFGLIDERTEQGRPIIVTTNADGDQLAERMSEDRGRPLIRRLRAHCDTIIFRK